ncbi:methyltransferase domain-containing protein [Streptomyces sp. TRM66268-LWL]|uniref:Methyltransferase domain-containing protein n=1 Tax=Streptomyces polyasparticus TaxID=2767826 RepID=A0ABR7SXQ4_9ACTN|nr:methyltransferase [Streptomyces polyasparticus]MBC9719412.1 methyltransferase domain-containing protein [Streptomyces polyasparticus]
MPDQHAPAPRSAVETLQSTLNGLYRFQYLSTAFELGLFAFLDQKPGSTRADIAAQLGLHEQPTRILLLGCTAFGLTSKVGDGYHNTPVATLLTDSEDRMPAALVTWHKHVIYRPIDRLHESLQHNTNIGMEREIEGSSPNLYTRLAGDPRLEDAFHAMMGTVSRRVAEDVAHRLDLSNCRHLLDVGGGTAVYAAELARRWPHLQITIVDLPSVVDSANQRIAELSLSDRVRAVALDAFADKFPPGIDAVLFAHFLEIWSVERIRTLLAKASRALPEQGDLYIVTPGQDDDETGPVLAATLSAYFQAVASGEGMVYTPREYEEWLTHTGFRPTGRTALAGEYGELLITAVKEQHRP